MAAAEGETAKKVIDSYIEAIGGRKTLEGVKDISQTMSTTIQGNELNITSIKKRPGKYMMSVSIPAANQTAMKYVINGDDVKVISRGQEQKLPEEAKESIKEGAVMFPELNYGDKGYQTQLLGIQDVNGKKTNVIEITTPNGEIIKEYYAVDSGLKLKQEASQDGNVSITNYSDYQEVNGVMLPYTQTSDALGRKMEMKMKEAKVNSDVDDSMFE